MTASSANSSATRISTPFVGPASDGSALLADLEAILNGVANLPTDLKLVIDGIISKLEKYDSILAEFVGTSQIVVPSASVIQTKGALSVPNGIDSLPVPALTVPNSTAAISYPSANVSVLRPTAASETVALLPATSPNGSFISATPAITAPPYPLNATSTTVVYSTSTVPSFDPWATNNIAVYFGSAPDANAPLADLDVICQDPAVAIINLAFLTRFFGADGYPEVDFGTGCSSQTRDQAEYRTGLEDCNLLGNKVQACQAMGKKVLASLFVDPSASNGSASNTFGNKSSAEQFATTLWDLFGNGRQGDADLRPLGVRPFGPEVVLDGFDVYVASTRALSSSTPPYPNGTAPGYSTDFSGFGEFFTALRTLFGSDTSKDYFISLSLPCSRNAAFDEDMLDKSDWVSIRFFGDPSCSINRPGFQDSLASWANLLEGPTPTGFETGTGVTIAASTMFSLESPRTLSTVNQGDIATLSSGDAAPAVTGLTASTDSLAAPAGAFTTFLIIDQFTTTITATVSAELTGATQPLPVASSKLSSILFLAANASGPTNIRSTGVPAVSPLNSTKSTNSAIPAAISLVMAAVDSATPSPTTFLIATPTTALASTALPSVISSFIAHRLGHAQKPRPKSKRGFTTPPFTLGLLAPRWPPSNNGSNGTGAAIVAADAAAGSAGSIDPVALEQILKEASGLRGFGGVALWGAVPDLESKGNGVGFLEFVMGVLDG